MRTVLKLYNRDFLWVLCSKTIYQWFLDVLKSTTIFQFLSQTRTFTKSSGCLFCCVGKMVSQTQPRPIPLNKEYYSYSGNQKTLFKYHYLQYWWWEILSKFNCTLRWEQKDWFIQLWDILFCYWSGIFASLGVGFQTPVCTLWFRNVWFVDGKSCGALGSVSVTCRATVVSTVHITCKKQVFFRK